MQITKAQLGLEVDIDTKEELVTLVNKLLFNDTVNFLITEKTSTLGQLRDTGEVLTSTFSKGYLVTIYSKNINEIKLLSELI